MGKTISIIHFQPVELYPPVMNLVRYIESNFVDFNIEIITTRAADNLIIPFTAKHDFIKIRRYGKVCKQQFFLQRIANYFFFFLAAAIRLIISMPGKVIYYETLSAYPVYLYRKYINRLAVIFIHYHEYTSKQEYTIGMKLTRFIHRKEMYLYGVAQWISHTNQDRIRLFIHDEGLSSGSQFHSMPNYPPESWSKMPVVHKVCLLKIVYVGAMSLDTMYTREFADWVIARGGSVSWDIYTNNITTDTEEYLKGSGSAFIRLYKGVDYFELPAVLEKYEVGIVLYKGHIPNYVYNAPNKLFEYMACGLDVWVPEGMEGCKPYYTQNSYPIVLPVNFQQLDYFDWRKAINKEGHQYLASTWYAEKVYPEIAAYLVK